MRPWKWPQNYKKIKHNNVIECFLTKSRMMRNSIFSKMLILQSSF